jgi:hypothetical protein
VYAEDGGDLSHGVMLGQLVQFVVVDTYAYEH